MPTDESLALRLQQGHPDALRGLVERHHEPLLGFLYRMTGGNRALAEDLVQEAFLRVLKAIGNYHATQPFKPWLYAIAVNLTRDHFKRADTRRSNLVGDEVLAEIVSDAEALDAGLLAGEEAQAVAAAIADLPPHQREALLLRYYQDLSLTEIALALNVPVGTVKSRLHLGLKRLKAQLESGQDEHERARA